MQRLIYKSVVCSLLSFGLLSCSLDYPPAIESLPNNYNRTYHSYHRSNSDTYEQSYDARPVSPHYRHSHRERTYANPPPVVSTTPRINRQHDHNHAPHVNREREYASPPPVASTMPRVNRRHEHNHAPHLNAEHNHNVNPDSGNGSHAVHEHGHG